MKRSPRSASQIVEEQVAKWRSDAAEPGRESPPKPVITVSHQHGSLGAELAELVADRLELTCWDRQLLDEIARHTGATAALVASLDERHHSIVTRIRDLFEGRDVTASAYMKALVRSVHAIAKHGGAVIVGRGAQHILEEGAALRVRVVRPFEERVEEVMQRAGIERYQAREQVQAVDEDRRRFIRDLYGHDNLDPTNYDLIVNTGSLSLESGADAVAAACRGHYGAP